jgi:hypothetical protein
MVGGWALFFDRFSVGDHWTGAESNSHVQGGVFSRVIVRLLEILCTEYITLGLTSLFQN